MDKDIRNKTLPDAFVSWYNSDASAYLQELFNVMKELSFISDRDLLQKNPEAAVSRSERCDCVYGQVTSDGSVTFRFGKIYHDHGGPCFYISVTAIVARVTDSDEYYLQSIFGQTEIPTINNEVVGTYCAQLFSGRHPSAIDYKTLVSSFEQASYQFWEREGKCRIASDYVFKFHTFD